MRRPEPPEISFPTSKRLRYRTFLLCRSGNDTNCSPPVLFITSRALPPKDSRGYGRQGYTSQKALGQSREAGPIPGPETGEEPLEIERGQLALEERTSGALVTRAWRRRQRPNARSASGPGIVRDRSASLPRHENALAEGLEIGSRETGKPGSPGHGGEKSALA
jgi:hypothetical protein